MCEPHNRILTQIALRALLILLPCVGSFVTPSMAQTSPAPANPQNPSTQSLQAGLDTSSLVAAPTAGIAPTVTTIKGVASISSSSRPGSLRSAGQGLQGMPGGPPIKGSLGYQDPASSYMRPPTIGPLACNPLLDGVCD
jgi:hypothetical protein